jgi:hypothetical protein
LLAVLARHHFCINCNPDVAHHPPDGHPTAVVTALDLHLTNELNERMPNSDDPLSSVFAALADPTRRAILARLAEGEAL